MKKKLTSEEKFLSFFSHISLVIPNIGIIVPLVIWITQKSKSNFIRFNALQAMFFQIIFLVLMILSIVIGSIMILIATFFSIGSEPNSEPGSFFFISLGISFLFFPIWLIFGIYSIIASIKSFKGKKFRYAIIGKIIERKIFKDQEEQ